MDPTLLSLLETIPQKPPRSKLETHRELIRQLRRKGCTYRDIVRILFAEPATAAASSRPIRYSICCPHRVRLAPLGRR
jgi:hypothetical protein